MIKYEDLYDIVKSRLSKKRFVHSEYVVKRAIEYAEVYGLDIEIVKLVAISHDIAKELSDEENNYYIKKYNIKLDDVEKINRSLLHAKIGACICRDEFGFTDDMVNAIRFHTTGRKNMSLLEKVICLADATEESRQECPKQYPEIIKNNIDEGMVVICRWGLEYILSQNKAVHKDTIDCYNYYLQNTSEKYKN